MRRTLALALLVIASSLGAAPSTLKLEPYRKTVALRATVGGREGFFVFDTAGGISLLSPQFAERIGCKPWGRMTGFRMMGERLDSPRCDDVSVTIGDRHFTTTMGVLDVMSLFPKDARPVDGLIALNVFAGKVITVDFPSRTFTIDANVGAGAIEVPARLTREAQGSALAVSVGVPTKQGKVWMELDSGNGGTILVNKPYAALFGLVEKDGPQAIAFDLANGLRIESSDAFAPEMIIDGNIGMPFLKNVAVTMDLASGRVWIAVPAPSVPTSPDAPRTTSRTRRSLETARRSPPSNTPRSSFPRLCSTSCSCCRGRRG